MLFAAAATTTTTAAATTTAGSLGWSAVLLALGAGAIGAVLTGLVGFGVRVSRIAAEVSANDRALRVLDRHLETWVADATVDLVRNVRDLRNRLNEHNLLFSGEYGYQVGLLKEKALHWYRDQERTAQSRADDIRARETWLHSLVRARRHIAELELHAPERVLPVLDRWAAPVTGHLGPNDQPRPLDSDPRKRTIESTLAMLDADPKALV